MVRVHLGVGLLLGLGFLGCHPRKATPPPQPAASLTLVAVGDILMHQDVKRAAELDPGGLPALWSDLVPLFQEADFAFGNLETPIAPTTGRPGVPFQFNAPAALPAGLRASGFTVLSTANNHAFDQGSRGVRETLERLRAEQLAALGSGEDRGQAERLQVLERQGLKVAFLGFTDLFNLDLNRRATEPWVRGLDLEPALQSVREARGRAHLVVVSLHWGNEYQHEPTRRQRDIARRLVEAGCDLVLGHHPHVLQPVQLLESGGRKGLVAYSLGNFISNQDRFYHWPETPAPEGDNRDGGLLEVELLRTPGQAVQVESLRVHPLWTENEAPQASRGRRIRVLSLLDAPSLPEGLRACRSQRVARILGLQAPDFCLRKAE